ncbi:hypothetical protein BDK92_1866 [Micromonospora pisi]|uniref:Uncharacterized protein n=1 Tax=Micromonospora pisi TaxID=589240 RepID=A0A495JF05_9ACTN|nr:hypothetical protein BDK92_1866 [Micromonospora pisi]
MRVPWWTPARTAVALCALFLLVSVGALVVPMARAGWAPERTVLRVEASAMAVPAATSSASAPSAVAFVCVRTDDDYCARYVAELARRRPLTGAQRAEAEAARERVLAALPPGAAEPVSCVTPNGPCAVRRSPPTLDEVRHALATAGHPDAVVRLAGATDPAPVGSVLLAAPVGPACVLAHVDGTGGQSVVSGRLPDGRCLAD